MSLIIDRRHPPIGSITPIFHNSVNSKAYTDIKKAMPQHSYCQLSFIFASYTTYSSDEEIQDRYNRSWTYSPKDGFVLWLQWKRPNAMP